MTDDDADQVGYGRPPRAHQFRKGQSGNRAGRPKGVKSLRAVIAASLVQRVSVTVNGRRCSITKLEAIAMQLANKAASGDRHVAKLLIDLLQQFELRDEAQPGTDQLGADELRAQDAAILAAVASSARSCLPQDDDAATA